MDSEALLKLSGSEKAAELAQASVFNLGPRLIFVRAMSEEAQFAEVWIAVLLLSADSTCHLFPRNATSRMLKPKSHEPRDWRPPIAADQFSINRNSGGGRRSEFYLLNV